MTKISKQKIMASDQGRSAVDGYTLTDIVDLNAEADSLKPAEARELHRRLRDLVPEVMKPSGYRGEGPRAPYVFPLQEVGKARVLAKLMELRMGAKSFAELLRYSDTRDAPGALRFASGLENGIAAALAGEECVVHLELLAGSSRVRAHFVYPESAEADGSDALIADHDAFTGVRVVARLSLFLHDALAPLRGMEPFDAEPAETETSAAPISREDEPDDSPTPPRMPGA